MSANSSFHRRYRFGVNIAPIGCRFRDLAANSDSAMWSSGFSLCVCWYVLYSVMALASRGRFSSVTLSESAHAHANVSEQFMAVCRVFVCIAWSISLYPSRFRSLVRCATVAAMLMSKCSIGVIVLVGCVLASWVCFLRGGMCGSGAVVE